MIRSVLLLACAGGLNAAEALSAHDAGIPAVASHVLLAPKHRASSG